MLNLLLVEDDIDLSSTIVDYLSLEDMICDHASNGVAGLNLVRENQYDVLVLDINMPQMDGLTLCKTLREEGKDMPILMLTARDTLQDKIAGFNAGTDDYLVKPFEMDELIIRLKALSKRRSGQISSLTLGDLTLDLNNKEARLGTEKIKLTPTTYRLLEALMRASPEPVSRNALLQSVWGDEIPDSNSLRVHIHNLRKSLAHHGYGYMIKTRAGFGTAISTDNDAREQ